MQLTPREYLNQYQQQYDSSRILNDLVAMLPPNGTGIYPLSLIQSKFNAYLESIPSPEYSPPAQQLTDPRPPVIAPEVVTRWKAKRSVKSTPLVVADMRYNDARIIRGNW